MPSPYRDMRDSYAALSPDGTGAFVEIGREDLGRRKDGTTIPDRQ